MSSIHLQAYTAVHHHHHHHHHYNDKNHHYHHNHNHHQFIRSASPSSGEADACTQLSLVFGGAAMP
jgi:hypothetical protein